jgi:outer membrane protein OmpA-like peptidoglycan-associated protein
MTFKITPLMMKITTILITLALLLCGGVSLQAQSTGSNSKPKDMYEFGVQGGYLFLAGEIDPEFGYAYGLHLRKATDYLFSLRLDLMMGKAKGMGKDGSDLWDFETNYTSAAVLGVFSLNSVRLDRPKKKVNIYAMIGGGMNLFEVLEYNTPGNIPGIPRTGTIASEIAPHATAGAGISFRLSNKINVGFEHQATGLFGNRSDLLDGLNKEGSNGTKSIAGDILQFTSLQMNFNLGNPASRSEPLYWGSLGEDIMANIDDVKKRQDTALADTDQDGVIDAIDQEPNTPANVPVDTKGRTLDSDKDGVADYKDLEPYYPPRAGERVNEDGVVINPIAGPGRGVTEERVQEMIDEALSQYGLTEPKNNVAEWFLPMIHFGTDNFTVKYSDYGTLASLARMLKSNPNMRLVITGYTDKTGPEAYNANLSYQRADAVAKHLVNQHGIGRGRLVIQYKGFEDALVPSTSSYMNRRVEFRVAGPTDVEMDRPTGVKSSGNDGY